MKNTVDWTENKIELLKVSFLQGIAFKEIGRTLGKTASALNKALNRFEIRLQKRKLQYIEWSPNDPHCQGGIPSFMGLLRTDDEQGIWYSFFRRYLKVCC